MTNLVVRIGLHLDDADFGLTPFDTEMRRRLWWHVSFLDVTFGITLNYPEGRIDFDGSEDLGRYFIWSKFILELLNYILTGIALLILNISTTVIYLLHAVIG